MGSGSSVCTTLLNLTSETIGDLVYSLGNVYRQYKSIIIDYGVTGELLSCIRDQDEFDCLLMDMDITDNSQQQHLLRKEQN